MNKSVSTYTHTVVYMEKNLITVDSYKCEIDFTRYYTQTTILYNSVTLSYQAKVTH